MQQRDSLPFPDWYYGGPFLRVANPDRDMPRRDPQAPITPDSRACTEKEGVFDGERFVAPFRDANRLEELQGLLLFAQGYPTRWDEDERFHFPTIQGLLAEAVLRLQTKISGTSNVTRRNWFTEALLKVREARDAYAAANYARGEDLLIEACALLKSGNKAHRRATDYAVDSNGNCSPPRGPA